MHVFVPLDNSKIQIAKITATQAIVLALVSGGFGLLGSLVQIRLSAPQRQEKNEADTQKAVNKAFERAPAGIDKTLPIGSIVCSVAEPSTFARLVGDSDAFDITRCVWVPADGRSVEGTPYATTVGSEAVPDLRGLFLRGLNYSTKGRIRTDVYADPDNNRDVAKPQLDELRSHTHPIDDPGHAHGGGVNGVLRPGLDGAELSMSPHNVVPLVKTGIKIEASGGLETRPKNAAVFYYIKIR